MTELEQYFTETSGKVVLECSLCHYETRAFDKKENHAFDCCRDGRVNSLHETNIEV